MQWNLTQVFVSNKQLCTPPEGALTANRGRHCLFCNKKKECLLKFLPLQYFRNNMPPMRINLCIPWCVIDKGFSAVQGKIVGLELFTGGHARPSLFCGSACYKEKRVNQSTVVCSVQRRTHIKWYTGLEWILHESHRGRGIWGEAHPPQLIRGREACLWSSHRIYSPHPWTKKRGNEGSD